MNIRLRTATLFLTVLAATSSAGVIVVDDAPGPGVDFTELLDAVGAAHDGDVILVKPGLHGPMLIQDKSLTVVADGPGVTIEGTIVQKLAAHRRVVLRGLTLKQYAFAGPPGVVLIPLQVKQCTGAVSVERCALEWGPFLLGPDRTAAFVTGSSRVVFSQSTLHATYGTPSVFGPFVPGTPGGSGLEMVDSEVWMHDSVCIGGRASLLTDPDEGATNAGAGVLAVNSSLHAFASQMTGGDGTKFFDPFTGSWNYGYVGAGIRLVGSTAELQGCAVASGLMPDLGGSAPIDGAGATILPGVPALLDATSPVIAGDDVVVRASGEPGSLAVLLAGVAQAPVVVPNTLGLWLVGPPPIVAVLGTIAPAQPLEFTAQVAALPPGVDALDLALQLYVTAGAGPATLSNPVTAVVLGS